jgi:predicted dehydrogenase
LSQPRDCRALGSDLSSGYNRRFAPVYKVLKQAIDSNELQPLSVHAKMNRGELVNPPWDLEREPHRRLSV